MRRKLRIFFEHVVVSLVNNSETRTLLYSTFLKKSAHMKEKARICHSHLPYTVTQTPTHRTPLNLELEGGLAKRRKGRQKTKVFSQKESHLNLQFDIFHNEL